MIIPTLRIMRQALTGSDVHGQPILGVISWEMVAPVKILFGSQHTTVRTDSSASHGNAYENVADVVILAKADSKIAIQDILTIYGNRVKVIKLHPRYRVTGGLNHVEIHCEAWK